MPITLWWDEDDNTILRADIVGDWTWEDYDAACDEVLRLVNGIGHRVDQIIDFTGCTTVPAGTASTHIYRGRTQRPVSLHVTALVEPPSLLRVVLGTFDSVFGRKLRPSLQVRDIEEARRLIAIDRARDGRKPTE